MKIIGYWILALYLLVFPLLELAKRILFLFVYPFAYHKRKWPREDFGFLWLALDDSIVVDNINRGFPKEWEFCGYGKKEPLGFITERMSAGPRRDAWRSWNWGAVRNNAINLAIVMEKQIGTMARVLYFKGGRKAYYVVRLFSSGARMPYFQWWLTDSIRLQCGWLCDGRFQVQFRNPRI